MATAPHLFHLTPAAGWMNDPNGLVEVDGVHHLFFQHHPDAPTFGLMRWGHATSTDLLSWTEHPTALAPVPGSPDAGGCWSGCAVELPGGRRGVLYTGVLPAERGGPGGATALRAVAEDPGLLRWSADPEPVIASWPQLEPPLTDWRDHTVLRSGAGSLQVVAAGTAGHDGAARLLAYTSTDPELRRWEYDGVLLDAAAAGLDAHVFECPDVFAPVGGASDELVVVLSWYSKDPAAELHHSSGALWLTGRLVHDGDGGGAGGGGAARFAPEHRGVLDLGSRFYAPQSYTAQDGSRRLAFGWLRTQDDPASAGRASVGAQSLPRCWSVVDGRLRQAPAAEVLALAGGAAVELDEVSGTVRLPRAEPAVLVELRVAGEPGAEGAAALAASSLVLVAPDGHRTLVDLSGFGTSTQDRLVDGAWVAEAPSATRADVLVDAGIVEVFTADGRAAASSDLAAGAVAAVEVTGPVRATVRVLSR